MLVLKIPSSSVACCLKAAPKKDYSKIRENNLVSSSVVVKPKNSKVAIEDKKGNDVDDDSFKRHSTPKEDKDK